MDELRAPHAVSLRRRITAWRESIFDAWTSAAAVKEWMCIPDLDIPRAEFDVRNGGSFRIDMRSVSTGRVWEHRGEYLAVERPNLLRFTWISEGSDGRESIVTLRFDGTDAETLLSLDHEGLPSPERARAHEEGWAELIENLVLRLGATGRRFLLPEATGLLARTPAVLDAWLRGLPASWLYANEGPRSWCPLHVLGHLVFGEKTDWIPRARLILDHGETRAFDPFDREGHLRVHEGLSVADHLEAFRSLRTANLATLADWRLGPGDFARRGRHPAFGPVTLEQLLATWVVHDLSHLAQIARVMAKGYAVDVGPWREYLPILGR